MAAVTTFSDYEAQENKICLCFQFFPFYLPWVMAPDAMILVFWMLSFKPAFSLSSFFINRLFRYFSLSVIRVDSFHRYNIFKNLCGFSVSLLNNKDLFKKPFSDFIDLFKEPFQISFYCSSNSLMYAFIFIISFFITLLFFLDSIQYMIYHF